MNLLLYRTWQLLFYLAAAALPGSCCFTWQLLLYLAAAAILGGSC
jgi:hypothetical protein